MTNSFFAAEMCNSYILLPVLHQSYHSRAEILKLISILLEGIILKYCMLCSYLSLQILWKKSALLSPVHTTHRLILHISSRETCVNFS